jgi:hypothetical protein
VARKSGELEEEEFAGPLSQNNIFKFNCFSHSVLSLPLNQFSESVKREGGIPVKPTDTKLPLLKTSVFSALKLLVKNDKAGCDRSSQKAKFTSVSKFW